MFARFTQDSDQQIMPYGVGWTSGQNFPLTPTIFKQGPARNASLNITLGHEQHDDQRVHLRPEPEQPDARSIDAGCGDYSRDRHDLHAPVPLFAVLSSSTSTSAGIGSYGVINNYSQFPYKNSNTTFDFYDNLNKIWGNALGQGRHLLSAQRKDQAAGSSMTINFSQQHEQPEQRRPPVRQRPAGQLRHAVGAQPTDRPGPVSLDQHRVVRPGQLEI